MLVSLASILIIYLPYICPTSPPHLPTSPRQVLGSLGSILIIWLAAGVLLYEGASPTSPPYLPISRSISPNISRYHPMRPNFSQYHQIPPNISQYLPISPNISPMAAAVFLYEGASRIVTLTLTLTLTRTLTPTLRAVTTLHISPHISA